MYLIKASDETEIDTISGRVAQYTQYTRRALRSLLPQEGSQLVEMSNRSNYMVYPTEGGSLHSCIKGKA